MKEKKKMSLAMQIFIALVLAIIAGLLMQNYTDFAESYIKPFGTIFLNLIKLLSFQSSCFPSCVVLFQ